MPVPLRDRQRRLEDALAEIIRMLKNAFPERMPVALYLRVSTEEQRERQSIATQNDFALRYCALHQLTIHQTYSDDGVSGAAFIYPLGGPLSR